MCFEAIIRATDDLFLVQEHEFEEEEEEEEVSLSSESLFFCGLYFWFDMQDRRVD